MSISPPTLTSFGIGLKYQHAAMVVAQKNWTQFARWVECICSHSTCIQLIAHKSMVSVNHKTYWIKCNPPSRWNSVSSWICFKSTSHPFRSSCWSCLMLMPFFTWYSIDSDMALLSRIPLRDHEQTPLSAHFPVDATRTWAAGCRLAYGKCIVHSMTLWMNG